LTRLGLAQPQAASHSMPSMSGMPGMGRPGRPEHPAGRDHGGGAGAASFVPVNSLDAPKLPFTLDNGVKVFHLIAEPVKHELLPGKVVDLWGYNGSAPGPMIEVQEGDRVRIIVDNHLPEMTSMHWHGLEIPFAMDGGPGLSQPPIPPGGRFVYEFTLRQEGTYFYHSHMAMQEMMGMIGAFIIHPREAYHPAANQDFAIILQEYAILPNRSVPNSMNMEFNWLTFNGKSGPATTPLVVRQGDRVRVRLINLGMDHHPIHLHGHQFWITGTEGGRQPVSNWIKRNTVLVGVAQAYDIEFDAAHLGNWMIHCHMPHHMMNNMASMVGPMTRTAGTPADAGMDAGMGIISHGPAISDENGPSLGRGTSIAGLERATPNGPLSTAQAAQMGGMAGMQMGAALAPTAPNANQVPGFPQDAFMEGPMMNMDAQVAKPENDGLPAGWSEFMQGMMTLVRVLPAEQYEHIQQLKAGQMPKKPGSPMPGMSMPGMDMAHPSRGGAR